MTMLAWSADGGRYSKVARGTTGAMLVSQVTFPQPDWVHAAEIRPISESRVTRSGPCRGPINESATNQPNGCRNPRTDF